MFNNNLNNKKIKAEQNYSEDDDDADGDDDEDGFRHLGVIGRRMRRKR